MLGLFVIFWSLGYFLLREVVRYIINVCLVMIFNGGTRVFFLNRLVIEFI